MASPQKEDGYTAIANEIMDALCRIRIPGEARQVFDVIFRKTYGWNKKVDAISLSQFVESTGLSKPHIIISLTKLMAMNLITEKGNAISEKGNSICKVYEINKDYESWKPLPKKVTLPKKEIIVTEKGNKPLPKKVPTITNKNKKTRPPFSLPEWIPSEIWETYLEVRNKKRAAKTDNALWLVIEELEKIHTIHNHDPVEVLKKSIRSGWTDVYPLKDSDLKPKAAGW